MASGVAAYLDTSALLKLYIAEPAADTVRQLVAESTLLCSHLITYAEMRAALARAARMERLSADRLRQLVTRFEQDWETLRVVVPDNGMIRRAGGLAEAFELRGYDSVHLAAAEAVANAVAGLDFVMAVYDARLAAAARSLGITVADGC